jgi:hypothetical protein
MGFNSAFKGLIEISWNLKQIEVIKVSSGRNTQGQAFIKNPSQLLIQELLVRRFSHHSKTNPDFIIKTTPAVYCDSHMKIP